ncbi:MAG: hypothetical protein LUD01_09305, partial [Clostridiales bacterium]|nr:hypothetical protein [Clostridiales bacterium]
WEEYGFSGEPGAGLNIIDPYGEQTDGISFYRLGTSEENGVSRLLLLSTFNHQIDSGFYRDPEINKIYEVETKVSQIILESKDASENSSENGFFEVVNEPVLNRFHGHPTNTDLTPLLTASGAYQAASPVAKAELEFIGNPAFDDPSAYYPEDEEESEAFVVWVGEQYMLTFTEMGTYLSEEVRDKNENAAADSAKKTALTGTNASKEPQYRNLPIRSAKDTTYLRKLFPERFEIFNRLTKVASGKMLP